MRLLLDTHVAIWSVLDPKQISPRIRRLIEDGEVFVSAVSIIEISIKFGRRRPKALFINAADALHDFEQAGFTLIDVTAQHAVDMQSIAVGHADPYDRLILAQALSQSLRLVTRDALLSRYSDTIITW
jgi:PIN domain nuclease of toxin-antitoxin system